MENASLKSALDSLAKQYQALVDAQSQTKQSLMASVAHLGQEIKAESERVKIVPAAALGVVEGLSAESDSGRQADEIERLKTELAIAKNAAAKCTLLLRALVAVC